MKKIHNILLVLILGFFISLFSITGNNLKADTVQDLKELNELYKDGVLTKEEFSKAKADVLGLKKEPDKEEKAKKKLEAQKERKKVEREKKQTKLKKQAESKSKKVADNKIKQIERMFTSGTISKKECIKFKKIILGEEQKISCGKTKTKSLIVKKTTKKKDASTIKVPITVLDHVKALGTFEEPSVYPDGMKKILANCKKFHCIQNIAVQIMANTFSRSSIYFDRHPGEQLYGMAYYEIFYQHKLKKQKDTIKKFIANWPNVKKKDSKQIVALLKLNKSRKKMRKALGMDLNTSVEEAMERYWILGDFLEQGEIKKKKVDKDIKKRGALLTKYQKAISDFNSAIKNQADEKLYAEINKKND